VIPKEIRDALQIDTGDSLAILMKHGKYIGLVKNEDVSELMDYINN
jgi:bifunctional DNA-binding transcriptional regulator/antitoxin component of YhaV-PrlF toxin-antitoxin module